MPDLDDRIRALVNDLVDAAPEPPAFDSLVQQSHPARQAPTWGRPSLVAVVAVVLVVASVLVAREVAQPVGGPAPVALARTPSQRAARTSQFVAQWADGEDDVARVDFGATLLAAVDPLRMQAVWSEATAAYGSLLSQAQPFETSSSPAGPQFTDTVQATFQRGQVDVFVVFDQAGHILTFGLTPIGKSSPTLSLSAQASRVVSQLAANEDDAVLASLDALSRVAATASELQTNWDDFQAAYGPYRGQGAPVIPGAGNLVNVPITWARASGYVQINFDQTGQIGSFFVLGPNAPPNAVGGRLVQANPAAAALAAATVADLTHGRFDDVRDHLDDLAAASLPTSRLAQDWQGVVEQLGSLKHVDKPAPFQETPTAIHYEIGLEFARGEAHIQVSVDTMDKIESLTVLAGPPSRLVDR